MYREVKQKAVSLVMGKPYTKCFKLNTMESIRFSDFVNSFGAKFQTTSVVCFVFNKLSLGKKFKDKVERLNVKQRRSR